MKNKSNRGINTEIIGRFNNGRIENRTFKKIETGQFRENIEIDALLSFIYFSVPIKLVT